jgi:hypothetical protein
MLARYPPLSEQAPLFFKWLLALRHVFDAGGHGSGLEGEGEEGGGGSRSGGGTGGGGGCVTPLEIVMVAHNGY